METQKNINWVWDCISETAFPRSWELGLHFKYHGSGIAFLQLWKQG